MTDTKYNWMGTGPVCPHCKQHVSLVPGATLKASADFLIYVWHQLINLTQAERPKKGTVARLRELEARVKNIADGLSQLDLEGEDLEPIVHTGEWESGYQCEACKETLSFFEALGPSSPCPYCNAVTGTLLMEHESVIFRRVYTYRPSWFARVVLKRKDAYYVEEKPNAFKKH